MLQQIAPYGHFLNVLLSGLRAHFRPRKISEKAADKGRKAPRRQRRHERKGTGLILPALCPTLGSKSDRGDTNNGQITIRVGPRNRALPSGTYMREKNNFLWPNYGKSTRMKMNKLDQIGALGVSDMEVTKRAHKTLVRVGKKRSPIPATKLGPKDRFLAEKQSPMSGRTKGKKRWLFS